MSLGWLAGTRQVWADDGTEQAVAWDLFRTMQGFLPGPSAMGVRSHYYQKGLALGDGGATILYEGVGDARGTVMLTVRQRGFEQAADAALDLFRWVVGHCARVSRLDLAGDSRLTERTPASYYELLPAARSRSRLASRVLTRSWSGEEKLTVGARVSDRYLRLYQTEARPGVVRHELELKGAAAGSAVGSIVGGASLFDVWSDQYRRLVEWPLN